MWQWVEGFLVISGALAWVIVLVLGLLWLLVIPEDEGEWCEECGHPLHF